MDPIFGGPVEGIRQLGVYLIKMGHTVEILTLDAPDLPFIRDMPFATHAIGPSQWKYRRNSALVPWLRNKAGNYDAVIINGIWNYHSFGSWVALKGGPVPYFVFTHGMLDPWFKRRYPLKHIKKWLYWPWADYRVLRDAKAVLFTSEEERLQARKSFCLYRANEALIKYGTKSPPEDSGSLREGFLSRHGHLRGQRIILYLGRIDKKKGVEMLIRAFASIPHKESSLHLVIAGPDNTGWGMNLRELADRLSISSRITWLGMVQGDLKWGAYYCSEAFILPSHQENFGVAVAEALGCARPVLISNKVNIWREIQSANAGLVESDDFRGTLRLLSRWLALDGEAREKMSRNSIQLFRNNFSVEIMAESVLAVIKKER